MEHSSSLQFICASSSSSSGRDFNRLLKSASVCCGGRKKKNPQASQNHLLSTFWNQEEFKPSPKEKSLKSSKIKDLNVHWIQGVGRTSGKSLQATILWAAQPGSTAAVDMLDHCTHYSEIQPCRLLLTWVTAFGRLSNGTLLKKSTGHLQLCHCLSS